MSFIREDTGKLRTKKIVTIVAVVAILIASSVLIYFYGFIDPEDMFADPSVEGDKDIGSILSYNIVDDDGKVTDTFDLKIVAQSGSYYFADVSKVAMAAGADDVLYQMFHKETGALRFAEEDGEDTFRFDGEEIDLTVWRLGDGDAEVQWSFSSSEADGIPYKIECIGEGGDIKAELRSKAGIISPAVGYERSAALDEFYTYTMEGTLGGEDVNGYMHFRTVAESSDGKFGLMQMTLTIGEDEDGEEVQTIEVEYEFVEMNLLDFLYMQLSFAGAAPKSGPETIDTIDGEMSCDVYTIDFPGVQAKTYIDPETKIVYLSWADMDGETYTITMEEYSLPPDGE